MPEYTTQEEIIARKAAIDAQIAGLRLEKADLAKIENEMVIAEVASRKPSPLGNQIAGM